MQRERAREREREREREKEREREGEGEPCLGKVCHGLFLLSAAGLRNRIAVKVKKPLQFPRLRAGLENRLGH